MSMTFLQLVQQLHEDCEVSGAAPTSVAGQEGEYKRLVNLTQRSWFDIQELHQNWKFMRLSASWASIDGQASYTPAQCGIASGTFGKWHPDRFNVRGYLTASGTKAEFFIDEVLWERYRAHWQYGTARDLKVQPSQYAIDDYNTIFFGPKPPAGYTFTADYYRSPVTLTLNDDVPALPDNHSPLIIMFKAMIQYGVHKGDPGLVSVGQMEYKARLNKLRLDQLPKVRPARTLA